MQSPLPDWVGLEYLTKQQEDLILLLADRYWRALESWTLDDAASEMGVDVKGLLTLIHSINWLKACTVCGTINVDPSKSRQVVSPLPASTHAATVIRKLRYEREHPDWVRTLTNRMRRNKIVGIAILVALALGWLIGVAGGILALLRAVRP
jgi:hypothetical protein